MTMKSSYDGYAIAEKDLAMRGPGDFLRTNQDSRVRQSGGVRFRLAELCEDSGLMRIAFDEAKALIESDPKLEGHPELKAEIDGLFALEASAVN